VSELWPREDKRNSSYYPVWDSVQ